MVTADFQIFLVFFFKFSPSFEFYTLSLHDALPILLALATSISPAQTSDRRRYSHRPRRQPIISRRSEEHTSELQSLRHLVCRLLLEKKKYSPSRSRSRLTPWTPSPGSSSVCTTS